MDGMTGTDRLSKSNEHPADDKKSTCAKKKQTFAHDFRDADFDGAVSSAQLTIFPELATGAQK
jgi:hypothetical protein